MASPSSVERVLPTREFQRSWQRVFARTSAWEWPFAQEIECGLVLYPTGVEVLAPEQFDILAKLRQQLDRSPFFLAPIEGERSIGDIRECWIMRSPTYADYKNRVVPLENVLFSQSGRWGLALSSECFGVLGADIEFVRAFRELYPQWAAEETSFRSAFLNRKTSVDYSEIAFPRMRSPE
jgi:hypothetical protein